LRVSCLLADDKVTQPVCCVIYDKNEKKQKREYFTYLKEFQFQE